MFGCAESKYNRQFEEAVNVGEVSKCFRPLDCLSLLHGTPAVVLWKNASLSMAAFAGFRTQVLCRPVLSHTKSQSKTSLHLARIIISAVCLHASLLLGYWPRASGAMLAERAGIQVSD